MKIVFIILCVLMLNRETEAREKLNHSSFKACIDKNIKLNNDKQSSGLCVQPKTENFKELQSILGVAQVVNFQKKIKDIVHTKIEFKIFETDLLLACATNDTKWFENKKIKVEVVNATCNSQLEEVKKSIRTRFPIMRKHLALTSSAKRESIFINDSSMWLNKKITHGTFSNFNKLNPITPKEYQEAGALFLAEMSDKFLEISKKDKNAIPIKISGETKTFNDILNEERKKYPKASDKALLTSFLATDKNYYIQNTRAIQDDIQRNHREEYFKVLNQMPLMGYIGHVDLEKEDSPSNQDIAKALELTKEKLQKYLSKLKSNQQNPKWAEYAQFTPDIEMLLEKNPEFCAHAEALLGEKNKEERHELYEDLALAGIAAVPCFMGGPISLTACIGGGLATGTKGVVAASSSKSDTLARNLVDFMGADGFANFQALDQKERDVVLQSVLLPIGAFGGIGTTGKAATTAAIKTYKAYDDVGRFISKNEGLDLANQAMKKLLANKNFDKMSEIERAAEFDKILADQVLPKHLLSFIENKNGGFKLIDTNYDFDKFPPEILDTLVAKLGSKDAAMKFIKETYHRHVLDHHGSLGNVQNATQQVLNEYKKRSDQIALLHAHNPIAKKMAQESALRDLKKEFFRVSTDNLGDGQLATYLVKNSSKEMLTDPKFVSFMNRVANIEDFEAFGPGIYKKFIELKNKTKNGITLNTSEIEELNAIQTAMARQKAINDTLLKYAKDEALGDSRMALLFADRFNGLPPEIQKKMVSEVDQITKKILEDKNFRNKMADDYVTKILSLAGTADKPGLVRSAEILAKKSYEGIDPKALKEAKDEIFAFNATKLRSDFKAANKDEMLGPFEVFHGPQPVLTDKKKILVSVTDKGEKRAFVVAFGNGLRQNADTLKSVAKEMHLVEKRTLTRLISETKDPAKLKTLKTELDAVEAAINNPNIEKFGGPVSLMRSAADNSAIKDLVFNFDGVRSTADDILEAVAKARAKANLNSESIKNSTIRSELFNN